ncbi:hypothetical protein MRB53_027122 [Persea americana]|uniref:Uncharacterized protein n=1 Tax=Persea americana TaxID=3435 RepID=A0ACC2LL90_PERAE|nr:hypothetical protein MRB53_027122 [Persea americana]|eukprot:TRINITY_DN1689_c0_g2_i1.p1 TRINITY_DN1689_c0_g2~~TRINITY_DN1689_c0_g2_i1.p1  ORF type:complete len:537 (-),score=127.50 TRINITY_DN1689_c0_g2_i1:595-2205(-)
MAPVSSTSASTSVSLKEYLKRYQNPSEDHQNKESKKKKKKKEAKVIDVRVRVVDEDPVWQKPQNLEEEDEAHDSSDEDKPQIDEDVEVKRMKRLEEIRSRRPYLTVSDDGSGWVSISENPKLLDSENGVSDMSPSRKRRARFDTPSPEHDESKPSSSKIPKPNLNSEDTLTPDQDLSPPRLSHSGVESFDLKMKNSGRHDSPDLSPPRRSTSDHERRNLERPKSPDLSPPRRNRSATASLGLERKNSVRGDSPDLSPPRRSRPQVASSDFRRKHLERNDSPDLSPPRLGRRGSPEFDASRATSGGNDLSPTRKNRKDSSSMKAGRKAGLITTDEIKEEINKKKKEELLRIAEMDPSISGRGSENVYRHQGKRISKDEFLKSQRVEEKPKEKKLEWGKGLAQKREAEARELELEMEKDKPFARTRDDPELDKMLKERIRWGDPMAHLVKRKQPDLILEDLGDDEKMKESGFLIPQTIPSHSWIKRGLDPPGNRYGIRPGRHWDGVDRSTGYEKEMFKRQNEKRATEREAYLWSVSDM